MKRGMTLFVPEGYAIRPTSSRVREALFNSLSTQVRLAECAVLDVFCGSGLMGLEAFSRGAPHVTFMDQSNEALAVTKKNTARMTSQHSFTFYRANALTPPPAPKHSQLIFLDPPYGKGLGEQALTALYAQGWIAHDAMIILEESSKAVLSLPSPFRLVKQKTYGITTLSFLVVGEEG